MIVQTENLSKWYGEVMGVNDVTLAIYPGITGLLVQTVREKPV